VFAFLLPNAAYASYFGVSPSVIEQEVVRGEKAEIEINILRANPKQDEWITVKKKDGNSKAFSFVDGTRVRLPLGEGNVVFKFTIDSNVLDTEDKFETAIDFTSTTSTSFGSGNKVLIGAQVKIILHLLDSSDIDQSTEYTDKEYGDSVFIEGLSLDQDKRQIILAIRNDSEALLKSIPFEVDITQKTGQKSSLVSVFQGPISPKQVQDTFVDVGSLDMATISAVKATIGEHNFEKSFRARWISSFGNQIKQIFRSKIISKLVSVDTTQKISIEDPIFIVTNQNKTSTIINSAISEEQEIIGQWDFFLPQKNLLYAIPKDDTAKQEYSNNIFRFDWNSIQGYDASELDWNITSITTNTYGKYALFSGTRNSDNTTFWCVNEVEIFPKLDCIFIDKILNEKIISVSPMDNGTQLFLVNTTNSAYVFDVWTKKFSKTQDVELNLSEYTEIKPLFDTKPFSGKFGFVRLEKSWFFVQFGSLFYPLEDGIYIQRRVLSDDREKISLVDARNGSIADLAEFNSDDTLYWPQKFGRITSP
jgi:hypothetical protein